MGYNKASKEGPKKVSLVISRPLIISLTHLKPVPTFENGQVVWLKIPGTSHAQQVIIRNNFFNEETQLYEYLGEQRVEGTRLSLELPYGFTHLPRPLERGSGVGDSSRGQ